MATTLVELGTNLPTTHLDEGHLFISNPWGWVTVGSEDNLLKQLQRLAGLHPSTVTDVTCYIWHVPLDSDEAYEINFYRPVVENCTYIGSFKLS